MCMERLEYREWKSDPGRSAGPSALTYLLPSVVKKRGSEIIGRTPQTKFLHINAGSLRNTELLTESRNFQTCFDPTLNESYLGSQNIYQRMEKLLWLIQRGGAHTATSTPLVAGLLPHGSVPF